MTYSPYQMRFDAYTAPGCFGDFDKTRTLCKKHCVLRLRCAIEQDQNMRMEMFDDWMADQDEALKMQ